VTGTIVSPSRMPPRTRWPANMARRVRWHILFRYIRYNGLRRPDVKRDESSATVADVDPDTSQSTSHDEVVDAPGS
jgi:hypothetical protein